MGRQDWPVAIAWLRDALYHDPNNELLKGLVAVATAPGPSRTAKVPASLTPRIKEQAAAAAEAGLTKPVAPTAKRMTDTELAAEIVRAVTLKGLDRYFFVGGQVFPVPADYFGEVRTYLAATPGKVSTSFIRLANASDIRKLAPGAGMTYKAAPVPIFVRDEIGLGEYFPAPADYNGDRQVFVRSADGRMVTVEKKPDGSRDYSRFITPARRTP